MEEGEYIVNGGDESEDVEEKGSEARGCLPVGKFSSSFRIDSIPVTGEQYLCQVRYQSQSLANLSIPHYKVSSSGPTGSHPSLLPAKLSVTSDQTREAISHYQSVEKGNLTHGLLKESLQSIEASQALSALCRIQPLQLSPSQLSDLRSKAKVLLKKPREELLIEEVSFIIIVAITFSQSDLIHADAI